MTHPAQHHVDASKKRQRAWVEGGARGGSSNRPRKAGALKGGASEDRETQSDTRPLVPHLRDARFPPPDTVAGAEEQKELARGGVAFRTPSGGVSSAARRETEAKHEAMPGGRFPIRGPGDLENAKHAFGRANDKPAVRRWINRRAKDLGEPPLGG